MKHLKTFEQLNESQSAYYEMMSEHPWLIDDVRFDEYVINHNDKQETDVHKIGYEEMSKLTNEFIALNHNILQNMDNPGE